MFACLIVLIFSGVVSAQQAPPPRPHQDVPEGVNPLVRGPLHEAFAHPYSDKPQPGFEVPNRRPPDPIDEKPANILPKDGQREPEWIPGYWAWDGEQFVWASGMWRYEPPGRRWVPGYWVTTQSGSRWVSGFWIGANTAQLTYLPPPPEPKESQPQLSGDKDYWVPGNWDYGTNGYGWRPGFRVRAHPNWVWIPARYVWTPRGYVFVDGYWDYTPERRGIVFAPVSFATGYRGVYRPSVLLDAPGLFVHLFARPRYQHYYFGDYYGWVGPKHGVYAWSALGGRTGFYDPLTAFYRVGRAREFGRIRDGHRHFVDTPLERPPHGWNDYRSYRARFGNNVPAGVILATGITQALRANNGRGFVRQPDSQLQRYGNRVKFYRDLMTQRNRFEQSQEKEKSSRWNVPPGQPAKGPPQGKIHSERPPRRPQIISPKQINKGKQARPQQVIPPAKRTRKRPKGQPRGKKGKRDQVELQRVAPRAPQLAPRPRPIELFIGAKVGAMQKLVAEVPDRSGLSRFFSGKDCTAAELKSGMRIRVTMNSDAPHAVSRTEALDKNPDFAKTG